MLTTSRGNRRPDSTDSKRAIVERAEAFLRAHEGDSVSLATVSRLFGLSERGLRNAFYGVRGMSPLQSIRAERLRRVRRALSERSAARHTVTDIAIGHGFYELGRFAAAYRKAFGELPSDTLRGSASPPPASTANHGGSR